MYNGIGLTTARGSGTNGYVQKNLSILPTQRLDVIAAKNRGLKHTEVIKVKKANPELLLHEQRRKIEIELLKLEDALRSAGMREKEIQENLDKERKGMTRAVSQGLLRYESQLQKSDSHHLAVQKEKAMQKFETALNIDRSTHVSGQAFDQELQAKMRVERMAARVQQEEQKALAALKAEKAQRKADKLRAKALRAQEKAEKKLEAMKAKAEAKQLKEEKKRLKKEERKRQREGNNSEDEAEGITKKSKTGEWTSSKNENENDQEENDQESGKKSKKMKEKGSDAKSKKAKKAKKEKKKGKKVKDEEGSDSDDESDSSSSSSDSDDSADSSDSSSDSDDSDSSDSSDSSSSSSDKKKKKKSKSKKKSKKVKKEDDEELKIKDEDQKVEDE